MLSFEKDSSEQLCQEGSGGKAKQNHTDSPNPSISDSFLMKAGLFPLLSHLFYYNTRYSISLRLRDYWVVISKRVKRMKLLSFQFHLKANSIWVLTSQTFLCPSLQQKFLRHRNYDCPVQCCRNVLLCTGSMLGMTKKLKISFWLLSN